ncbi:MAG: tetratricopeptide repeat protein [Proteobacteria bacterium]|nr:tetratricopeptide repeat protein [Pseudomonadota bacterium]
MEQTKGQDKNLLFQNRSSSKEFLLSKAELGPLGKIYGKKKDGRGKGVLNKLFPGMLDGDAFSEYALKFLNSYHVFGAIIMRIDNMNRQENEQDKEQADRIISGVAKTIDDVCRSENGFWGQLDLFEFGCYFPDKNSEGCLNLAVKIKVNLEKIGKETVTSGVAEYPAFSYKKHEIIENARKALEHADFFGPGSIVTFDAVSLNISGDKLYQNGDINGAIKEFMTALQFDPPDVNVHNSLGVCYAVLGDFSKAIKEFKEAIRLSPAEIMPMYNAGLSYQLMGKKEKALKHFIKAGNLGENLFEIDFQTGKILLELGRPEEGKIYLEKALKLRPESSIALFYLGEIFAATGMADEAEATYEKAIKINPNDAASLSSLGLLYEQKGKNHDISLTFCRQSVEISPENGLFRQRLGRIYHKHGLLGDAMKEFEKAEELGCESGQYIDNIRAERKNA